MNRKEAMRQMEQIRRLETVGFTQNEAETLRRISMALSRWAVRECNGEVEVEDDGKAFHTHDYPSYTGKWQTVRYAIPNSEAGAIRRLGRMMQAHPGWDFYHQTDPRGAALYLIPLDKVNGNPIDSVYSSIGICVY